MWLLLHTLPQTPQLVGSLRVSTSQPSLSLLPLQSTNPESHAPLHTPPAQVGVVMWLLLQPTPQPPQWAASVAMFCSHPFVRLFASQSAQPLAHAPLHTPPPHVGVGTWLLLQAMLHPPQLAASVAMFCSHPFVRLSASQSAQPRSQAPLHTPPAQAGVETWLLLQAMVQPPQLVALVKMSCSQPSVCLLTLQSAHPESQAPLQTPPLQVGVVMWLVLQILPHTPQLAVLVATFCSQPSVCLLRLQSAHPESHVPSQTPPLQVGVVTWLLLQTLPHPPQVCGSVVMLASHPSVSLFALQSA
jgi:hypothetical protein